MECLKYMLNVPGQGELYIVVDALDECPNFPGCPTPREQVLEILQELVVLRLPHVHFCFTSRHVLSTDSSGPSLLRRTLWVS
jgi:hypothetical protein